MAAVGSEDPLVALTVKGTYLYPKTEVFQTGLKWNFQWYPDIRDIYVKFHNHLVNNILTWSPSLYPEHKLYKLNPKEDPILDENCIQYLAAGRRRCNCESSCTPGMFQSAVPVAVAAYALFML